ncbi:MAG: DNA alkylation repair protein [Bacteroidota bacterium]
MPENKLEGILHRLYALANPKVMPRKAEKYGITAENALGIYLKDIKVIAKDIGKDNALAIALFDTGIYEARLLCSRVFKSKDLTPELMEQWANTFENWEITDSFSMKFFTSGPHVDEKILEWTSREETFVKRAGFVMMASYSSVFKKLEDTYFEDFFPIIEREADDDRVYVKKAVNWALRNIGKRNEQLREKAIDIGERLIQRPEKSAQWIGKDACRELKNPALRLRGYPRK